MHIRLDDLRGPEIAALLEQHLADMHAWSPAESVHALDLERLRQPEIRFWSLWEGAHLLGCGALKQLDAHHGEIKSMRTTPEARGRGVASAVLCHIVEQARQAGLRRISLETGTTAGFAAAHRLYERHGFVPCGPFGDYREDPYSLFMTRSLAG
ncbi:MAG: GNAT family N-acetyltransferase [Rhodoferax sp.]